MKTLLTFLVIIFLLTTAQAQETEEPLGSEGSSEIDATLAGNSASDGFSVKEGANTLFRVRGDGNVGIGITSPSAKLDVSDGDLHLTATSINGSSHIRLIENPGTIIGGYLHYDGDLNRLFIGTNFSSDVNAITILRGSGNVRISNNLDVDGNATFSSIGSGTSAGALHYTTNGTLTTSTSDRRLKENIRPLAGSLNKVLQLQGVMFNWREDASSQDRIGMIAQEVQQVVPELVFQNPNDGYYGVRYSDVSAILVEAIKEQQKQIEALERKISSLTLKEIDRTSYGYTKTNYNK